MILDLQKNWENSSKFPYSSNLFLPLTFYNDLVHLLQLMNQQWFIITAKAHSVFEFPFSLSTFPAWSHPGYHIAFNYHVSLRSSWLWQFLWLYFDDLDCFEEY
jgi:hypothetical protein